MNKQDIAKIVNEKLKENKLSYRRACEIRTDLSYTQFTRVAKGENYGIDTLLKILDVLGLEAEIKEKQ